MYRTPLRLLNKIVQLLKMLLFCGFRFFLKRKRQTTTMDVHFVTSWNKQISTKVKLEGEKMIVGVGVGGGGGRRPGSK